MAGESVLTLISKVGSLFSIPIRFSDRLLIYDAVFTSGTSFHGWVKKVALDNNKSTDEILAMMGQLPEMFK